MFNFINYRTKDLVRTQYFGYRFIYESFCRFLVIDLFNKMKALSAALLIATASAKTKCYNTKTGMNCFATNEGLPKAVMASTKAFFTYGECEFEMTNWLTSAYDSNGDGNISWEEA